MIDKFNIRVYGILIQDEKILISNENIEGFEMLKLPGGGLEYEEGIHECLKREFYEELGINVRVADLVHVTSTFIQSVFKQNEQVIAVHYKVCTGDNIEPLNTIQTTTLGKENVHTFEWRNLNDKLIDDLTFDMDKEALSRLLNTKD